LFDIPEIPAFNSKNKAIGDNEKHRKRKRKRP